MPETLHPAAKYPDDYDEVMISTLITFTAVTAMLGAVPGPPLTGTRWVVTHFVDGAGVTPAETVRPAYLVLDPSGSAEGYDTCNWITATAAATDHTLTFTGVGTTKRMCGDTPFRVQWNIVRVFDGEIAYRIENDDLWLTHPAGYGLVLRAEAAS